jgi:hypothetical protein
MGETLRHIISCAQYNVACSQEAHAHYGEKFNFGDACFYFIQGALVALRMVVGNAIKGCTR